MNKWQKRGLNLEFLTIDVHPKSLLSLKIMMWGSDMILLHKFFNRVSAAETFVSATTTILEILEYVSAQKSAEAMQKPCG